MTILHAALLGCIEGITEFLPISSTGHLILAERLLGISITEAVKTFDIAIQLGAILAVCVLYARMLLRNRRLCILTLTAFIPTALIGFLLHGVVKAYLLGNVTVVAWSLLLGGIVLLLIEWIVAANSLSRDIDAKRAIGIGFFQSIALVPGVSRAGATIVGGMLMGIPRATIVEFSFLLAIPTMLSATALDLLKTSSVLTAHDALLLGIGFVTSFLTALFAIRWLLQFISAHTFIPFAIYRIALGLVFLLFIP